MKIHEIPYNIQKPLQEMLDFDEEWKALAAYTEVFTVEQIQHMSHILSTRDSPTQKVLFEWSICRNPPVMELLQALFHIRHFRALQLLRDLLENNCPQLIESGEVSFEEFDNRINSKIADNSKPKSAKSDGACSFGPPPLPKDFQPPQPPPPASHIPPELPNNKGLYTQVVIVTVNDIQTISSPTAYINHPSTFAYDKLQQSGRPIARELSLDSNQSVCSLQVVSTVRHFSFAEINAGTERFEKKHLLGCGSFGAVFRATMKGTTYAVRDVTKFISPDETSKTDEQAFVREVDLLQKYQHPNIVQLFGICLERDVRCLVFELLTASLFDCLQHKTTQLPALTWLVKLRVLLGAARGLEYLHCGTNKRVIHGAVKSSNILLNAQLQPKLADFGMAQLATKSDTGNMNGTHVTCLLDDDSLSKQPHLPDEFFMDRKANVKTDIYCFGLVIFECLTEQVVHDVLRKPEHLKDYVNEQYQTHKTRFLQSLDDLNKPTNGEQSAVGISHEQSISQLLHLGGRCTQQKQERLSSAPELCSELSKLVAFESGETSDFSQCEIEEEGEGKDGKCDEAPTPLSVRPMVSVSTLMGADGTEYGRPQTHTTTTIVDMPSFKKTCNNLTGDLTRQETGPLLTDNYADQSEDPTSRPVTELATTDMYAENVESKRVALQQLQHSMARCTLSADSGNPEMAVGMATAQTAAVVPSTVFTIPVRAPNGSVGGMQYQCSRAAWGDYSMAGYCNGFALGQVTHVSNSGADSYQSSCRIDNGGLIDANDAAAAYNDDDEFGDGLRSIKSLPKHLQCNDNDEDFIEEDLMPSKSFSSTFAM